MGSTANSLEGLIEWNSVAPSSSRERLQSGANTAFTRVSRCWVGSTQAVRWRPVSRIGVALPQNLMQSLSCKPIAPVPKLANRTPLDRGVQDLALSAQKGRDAIRPPQTHPEARSAAITWAERRPRRIPPRRHRPKPPQARQADPGAGVDRCDLKRRGAHEHDRDRRFPPPQYFKTDFFNGIGHETAIRRSSIYGEDAP